MLDPLVLSQQLIRCASVTPQDAGVMDVLVQAVQAAGFQVWQSTNTNAQGRTVRNMFAKVGQDPPALAFVGHVDVVPPGNVQAWTHPPFAATVANGYLYGRGAADMKSAIACFVAAAERYRQQAPADKLGSLALLITGDEEVGEPEGMRALIAWCQQHSVLPQACLIGEATSQANLGQALRVGRRGSLSAKITAYGIQGHVAYPERARNAATLLLRYLHAVQNIPLAKGNADFGPSHLEITSINVENQATNVIPAVATAQLNIRFNAQDNAKDLQTWLVDLAKDLSADVQVEISVSGEPYVFVDTALAKVVTQAIEKVIGITPVHNTVGGVSDGRFLHTHCPVIEFGMVSDTIHQVDERILVADIERLTAVYQQIIQDFF